MSGNGYGYYYPSNAQNFPADPNQTWNDWLVEQQQYNHSGSYTQANRSQNYYNPNNRHFQQRRFNSQPPQQQPWQKNNYNKRPRQQESLGDLGDLKNKKAKKRKKPLSQNIPSKKDWTYEEAEMALSVEKEYNKRFKNHSLVIKFPDQELNKDIVSKFHPSIESVHFQLPSTPRFCFVTLKETVDADTVIETLNKIKFGEGYLTAEYKRDREEDQVVGPEDIDPCTLYVGNLAQEITKEDMVKTYPKGRRIDIGYAKKMKYTRYAFVSFKNVSDSIEAFKKTHSTQMYSKSLIVRFRRLHGTVGMPGESKPQSTPTKKPDEIPAQGPTINERTEDTNDTSSTITELPTARDTPSVLSDLDLSVVKQEINSSDDEQSGEHKSLSKDYESPFMPGSINIAFEQHKPMMIKKEIKTEVNDDVECVPVTYSPRLNDVEPNGSIVSVKDEPSSIVKKERDEDDSSEDDEDGGGLTDVNFSSLLNQLGHHSSQIESLRKWAP